MIGPKTDARLAAIGIHDADALRGLGAVEAFRRLKAAHPGDTSLNALWAMQAFLMGIRWTEIPADLKARLKEELSR